MNGKRILLVITGGIAAYKCLELIRRIRERGGAVRCLLTEAAEQFVTPTSLAALSGEAVHRHLFHPDGAGSIGHIQLSRDADLVVVAPATANILAKAANGIADDLASTTLLATDTRILVAPTMNVRMWEHAATQANMQTLEARGVLRVGPNEGPMACNEYGPGRMAEPDEILAAIEEALGVADRPLAGLRALVTSGPTFEALDPVRFIGNRSSGKQGHAIAAALAAAGAQTTLMSGPTFLADPACVQTVHVESALQMLDACKAALPADIAVCAAAVSDWRVADPARQKIKKGAVPDFLFIENPDILATLAIPGAGRPSLVVGFAAETENVVANAQAKRKAKGCDWILANDVSPATGTFGGDANTVHWVHADGVEDWPKLSKQEVASRLVAYIVEKFKEPQT